MASLTYRTAGESHGPALIALIEGLPADLPLNLDRINASLRRRQGGYGRSGRQRIEQDEVLILSGVRRGLTTGAPLALQIANRDSRLDETPPVHNPRPGHADFAGAMKWMTTDCRNTLERASARETAARVACGAIAKQLLNAVGIHCVGFVREIGGIVADVPDGLDWKNWIAIRDANEVYSPDDAVVAAMSERIHHAKKNADTVGGVVEVRVIGVPPGLGSCAAWDQKLDGRLMQALGSIQAVKAVEIGAGFAAARLSGSQVHDAIRFDPAQRATPNLGFVRDTNRAGGIEGGMTNGQPIVVRAAMKPISTLLQGMDSVNLATLASQRSDYERSDICAVPAASVVAEHVVALEIARALLDKFAGDTLGELQAGVKFYLDSLRQLGQVPPSGS